MTSYTPPIANNIDNIHEQAIIHARNALLSASIQEYRSMKKIQFDNQKITDAVFWIGAVRDITNMSTASIAASRNGVQASSAQNPPRSG
jgi:hypothetical protein